MSTDASDPRRPALLHEPETGLLLDLGDAWSALGPEATLPAEAAEARALHAMRALEAGAIANMDEGRQVGHYWLRAPELAPTPELQAALRELHQAVAALELGAHDQVLWIGIGGSALGPQLLADCLAEATDPATLHFLDNTDPDGFARVLRQVAPARCLAVVVSKSGGTVETVNALAAARARWETAGEPFAPHAVALTGEGSSLDELARAEGWRARLPIWDWVGGRTSLTGAVGLVAMALCGWDWRGFLAGAAAMDRATRAEGPANLALSLARAWYAAGGGRGERALVVLPYKDRLGLVGRYLQQLVMESLGKQLDRQGRTVHQGLTVYGNKGSTDQHAFVQQVRDGRDDTFVHFIETLDPGPALALDDGTLASDHLLGFLWGTRRALREEGRPSLTLSLPDPSARSLGALVALFERAVGYYAELIDVNAYHQPGVEAGKRAARSALGLLARLREALSDDWVGAQDLAHELGEDAVITWRLLVQLAETGRARREAGEVPWGDRFRRA